MFQQTEQIEKSVVCSYMNPPGIVRFEILDSAEIGIKEVECMHAYAMKVCEGRKYGVVFMAGPMFHVTKEARELGDEPRFHTHVIAQGLVVNSLSQRLVGNFIMRFKKYKTETRLFKTEEEAINWLIPKL